MAIRDGDPFAAASVAVVIDGGIGVAVPLARIFQLRMQQRGIEGLEVRVSSDGIRIRGRVLGMDRVDMWPTEARAAILAPIVVGSEEARLLARQTDAIHPSKVESAALDPIVACTGEGIESSHGATLDIANPNGVEKLEPYRARAATTGRIAFGWAGPEAMGGRFSEALERAGAWPTGPLPPPAWPERDTAAAFLQGDRPAGNARLRLAFWIPDAAAGLRVTRIAGGADATAEISTRLDAFASAWRLADLSSTAHAGWGCVDVTLESSRSIAPDRLAGSAGQAATIVQREIARRLDPLESAGVGDSWGAVRRATDPRDAAELLAWWALSTVSTSSNARGAREAQGETPSGVQPIRAALALGISPTSGMGSGPALQERTQAIGGDLLRAFAESGHRWERDPIAPIFSLERGQGTLALLVASPCGTQGEMVADAGLSALAATAAADTRRDDVRLRPWISADGIGLVAQTEPRLGEPPGMTARRLGDAAGRALASRLSAGAFAVARSTFLRTWSTLEGVSNGVLWGFAMSVAPPHPSAIWPLGGGDSLAHASVEGAIVRWRGLMQGPLRLAVIAGGSERQPPEVARALGRWLPHAETPAACPTEAPFDPPQPGMVNVVAPPGIRGGEVIVGVAVPLAEPYDRALAELTTASLGGSTGWLARALGTTPIVSASARILGGGRRGVLMVHVRAPEGSLDRVVAQVRGLFQRLHDGAASEADLARGLGEGTAQALIAEADPSVRLIALWRRATPASPAVSSSPSPPPLSPPSLDEWREYATTTFADDRLTIVIARPRH